MKLTPTKNATRKFLLSFSPFLLLSSFLLFSSFRLNKTSDDFLKQLGISKTSTDEKITNSILGGSIDAYGVKNAKNILAGNRKAVALDLLNYTRKYVQSEAYIQQYNALKESYKPKPSVAQTPEQMRSEHIALAKKSIAELEETVKKSDANTKPIFEKVLLDAKKNLKTVEDPNNKTYVFYAKNYESLVKSFKDNYEAQLAEWEKKFPSNHLLYVKMRLQEFMNETKDIDFNAELVVKNGKKIFVNRAYEIKSNRWKMAFRAGREVVEPSREFVQNWIDEIK